MKLKQNSTEKYVSLRKFFNRVSVRYSTLKKLCCRLRFRLFKFNGVVCLELSDCFCLLKVLLQSQRITDSIYNTVNAWLLRF